MFPSASTEGPVGVKEYVRASSKLSIEALPSIPQSAGVTLTTGASGTSSASSISNPTEASEVQSPSPAVTVYSVPAVNPLIFPSASPEGPVGVKVYVRASSKLSIEALPATPQSAGVTLTTGASGTSSASSISNAAEASETQSPSPAVTVYSVPAVNPLMFPSASTEGPRSEEHTSELQS